MINTVNNAALYNSISEYSPSDCRLPILSRTIVAAITGLLTSLTYYKSAKSVAGDNDTLGVVYGVSNVAALTFLNAWFFHRVFLVLERQKITFDQTFCFTLVKLLPVLFLSMVSSTPDTYVTYQYNKDAKYLPALAFISDTVSGVFLFSELRACVESIYKYGFSHSKNTQKMAKILEQGLQVLLSESNDLSQYALQLTDAASVRAVLGQLVQRGIRHLSDNSQGPMVLSYAATIHTIISSMFALLWQFTWLLALNQLTRSGLTAFGVGETVATAISCVSIIPDFVLSLILGHELYDKLLVSVNRMYDRTFCQNFESRFYPISYYVTKFLTYLIMIIGFGDAASTMRTAFPDNNFFIFSAVGAIVLSRLYVASDLLNHGVRSLPLISNENQVAHMRLHHAVKEVSGFLTECSPQQLSALMTDVGCDQQAFSGTPNPHSLFQLCSDGDRANRVEIVDADHDDENHLEIA